MSVATLDREITDEQIEALSMRYCDREELTDEQVEDLVGDDKSWDHGSDGVDGIFTGLVDPKKLKQHPEAAKYPQLPAEEFAAIVEAMQHRGYDPAYPLKLSSDGLLVIDGEARRRAAIEAGIEYIPATPCSEDEDEAVAVLAAYVLRRNLTDDQRAVLALRYQAKLVELRNMTKGAKGAKSRNGDLSVSDKSKERSRQEAAKKFRVPENKLKTLAAIEKWEEEQKVPEKDSLIPKVLSGEIELSKAGEPAAEAKRLAEAKKRDEAEAAKQEADKKAREERAARIKTLPDLPAIQEGTGEMVLQKQFKGDQKPPIDLLIIDSADPSEVAGLLKSAKPVLSATFGIFIICDFENEAEIVKAMRAQELTPIRFIWDQGDNEEKPPTGTYHQSILWAGTKALHVRRGGDCFRGRKSELWTALIKLAAQQGDYLFFPCATDEAPAIQSELAKCRPVAAITKDHFLDAREKYDLQTKPDKWFALHSNFPQQSPATETAIDGGRMNGNEVSNATV